MPCGGDALEPIVGLTSRADWASSSAICASISSVRAATSRDQFTEPETERRDGDSGVDAAISLGCFVARSLTYSSTNSSNILDAEISMRLRSALRESAKC